MEPGGVDHPHWKSNLIGPVRPPRNQKQVEQDLKWRPARPPEEVPWEPKERTWKAVTEQCLHSAVPGYTGFIPSARAEDVCARTQAAVGERAVQEQARRERLRAASFNVQAAGRRPLRPPSNGSGGGASMAEARRSFGDEHPLGRSQCFVQKGHWVPTIPGYSGYTPGKHAENICGGGIMHTCKMAGRAIAERGGVLLESEASEHWRARHVALEGEASSEQIRLASHLREHCERHIPGYSGHVPRVHADSICGAGFRARNLLAADIAEDRVFHPERHIRDHCAPQAPCARKLRI